MIGFTDHLHTPLRTTRNYNGTVNLHTLQLTVIPNSVLSLLVSTSRFLATDFNTGPIAISLNYTLQISRHYSTHKVFSSQPEFQLSTDLLPSRLNFFDCHIKRLNYPRYIASRRPQQKTPFPKNFPIVIEACLPRRCIEMVVLLLLGACSFPREPVYRVVA
jgi:hypothetical protein